MKSFSDLIKFAEKELGAESYPNDHHIFEYSKCKKCHIVPFKIFIEFCAGSTQPEFRGRIWGKCKDCGERKELFSFKENDQKVEEREPVCECGNKYFYVGVCERIEGSEKLAGFFDEGVVVGQCSECGKNHAFVYTD